MRLALPLTLLVALVPSAHAESALPNAPSATRFGAPADAVGALASLPPGTSAVSDSNLTASPVLAAIDRRNAAALDLGLSNPTDFQETTGAAPTPAPSQTTSQSKKGNRHGDPATPGHPYVTDVDEHGNPIPLELQQPKRILGFMPNFRSVSGGSVPPPPTFRNNFRVATRQAFDYSSFFFLGLTSISAEGINSHPVLGKGVGGFWAYTWRGFLDKTDGTYLSAWLLPSILREDTRFYALGRGSYFHRSLYVISRQGVARTYSGRQTPNIAGLGGKVLTQVISRYYYPTGATSFGVLAEKFGYASMRDIAFTSVREFYPDIAAHYIKKHRAKVAAEAARDAAGAQSPSPVTPAH